MEITMHTVWVKESKREKNCSYLFLSKRSGSGKGLRLWLCAENNYRIHINGEFMGFGPSRCAHGVAHIDEFSLSERFSEAESLVIAVEVSAYRISALYDADAAPFFAARLLDEAGNSCGESEDFCAYRLTDFVQAVPRYSWQRYFLECYQMKKDRTGFYLGETSDLQACSCEPVESPRLAFRNVPYPTYEKIDANRLEQGSMLMDEARPPYTNRFLDERVGENGFMPWELEADPVKEVQFYTYKKGEQLAGSSPYTLYDLSANRSGFFGMKLHAATKARVVLVWDELLDAQGRVDPMRTNMANMLSLSVEAGNYRFESFQPYTARYVAAVVREGEVEIEALYMRSFENPHAERLHFEIEDKRYAALMQAAQRTFAQNTVDIPTDCPSRERVGWLCDSFFISAAEQLFCGENPVERHFLENYAEAPQASYIPDGMIPMSYPGYSVSKNYICNWALWYILELHEYFCRTEDREMIEHSRQKVFGVLSCLQRYENEEGLLEDVPGWVFVEWSRANDFVSGVNFPSNMLYCAALEATAKLYGGSELAARAADLRLRIAKYAQGEGLFFCDHAVRRDGRLSVVKEDISETCQYYAFYFGFADAKRDPALLQLLLREFGAARDAQKVYPQVAKSNAFIGNLLRLSYLSQNGFAEEALRQTVEYYLHQALRTGTLWEYAEEYKSCNHGFASYIADILLRGLTGYHGLRGKTVLLLPMTGRINCKFRIPLTPSEYLTLEVKNGKRSVALPSGYQAELLDAAGRRA